MGNEALEPGFDSNRLANVMLVCKEMYDNQASVVEFYRDSKSGKTINFEVTLPEGMLAVQPYCDAFNIPQNPRSYRADQYPVSAPVTYFQGSWDAATQVGGARLYWKHVPRGPSQLVIGENGGHSPMFFGSLMRNNPVAQKAYLRIKGRALRGGSISDTEMQVINSAQTTVKWSIQRK